MNVVKIVEFNDLHYGIRNGDAIALAAVKRWQDFALKELEKEEPDYIIFNGDTFDNRRCIHSLAAVEAKKFVLQILDRLPMVQILMSVGNHDAFYRDSNLEVSSVRVVFDGIDRLEIIDKPLWFVDEGFAIVPWINKQNYSKCMELISTLKKEDFQGVLFTHLDIIGSKLSESVVMPDGFNTDIFPNKSVVINGHIHYPSVIGKNQNIINVGIQYEMARYARGRLLRFPVIDMLNGMVNNVDFVEFDDRVWLTPEQAIKYEDLTDRVVIIPIKDEDNNAELVEEFKRKGALIDFVPVASEDEIRKKDDLWPELDDYVSKMSDLWDSVRTYVDTTVSDKKKAKVVKTIIERAMT